MSPALEAEIRRHIDGARDMGKDVLLPLVRSFSELFPRAEVVQDISPGRYKPRVVHRFGDASVRSYCGVRAGGGVRLRGPSVIDVEPAPGVLRAVEGSMLSSGYTIDFKVVVREGAALVAAYYEEILGDRWLAMVDISTIPGWGPPKVRHMCSVCRQQGHNARTCERRGRLAVPAAGGRR